MDTNANSFISARIVYLFVALLLLLLLLATRIWNQKHMFRSWGHEILLKRDRKQESGRFDTKGDNITKNNVEGSAPARYFSSAKMIIKANCKIVMLWMWLGKKAQTMGTTTEIEVCKTAHTEPGIMVTTSFAVEMD